MSAAAKAPPISERPLCPYCKKPRQPQMTCEFVRVDTEAGFHTEVRNRRWGGGYHGYGAFCTLRCCERFANAAYRGGYRMKK